jgi:hypothetical protein
MFVKYASFIYEPGATESPFYFNSDPKKAFSLSLDVKCDQQTHKKLMSPIMASISRKISNKKLTNFFKTKDFRTTSAKSDNPRSEFKRKLDIYVQNLKPHFTKLIDYVNNAVQHL